jgi:hypothetical protein
MALVEIDGAGELLDVDHVRQVPLFEPQHGERPARGGVTAGGERGNLEGHVPKVSHLEEVLELGAHHRAAADRASQHGLVHDRPDLRRPWPGEQALAAEAQADPAFDLGLWRGLVPEPGDGSRVVLGLEQAVHELDLETADGRSGGFQPEVRLEPVRQDVGVLHPPVRRVGPLDLREKPRLPGLVGHAVQDEEIPHVTALEADPAGLQPADLGPGRTDLGGGVLGRDASGLAKAAQPGAEQHAEHGRIDRGIFQAG